MLRDVITLPMLRLFRPKHKDASLHHRVIAKLAISSIRVNAYKCCFFLTFCDVFLEKLSLDSPLRFVHAELWRALAFSSIALFIVATLEHPHAARLVLLTLPLLEQTIIIIIIIGIYIAPFPFIKCSKALHIVIVWVIVNNASMGEPEKVRFETLLEDLTWCRILQVLWKRIP